MKIAGKPRVQVLILVSALICLLLSSFVFLNDFEYYLYTDQWDTKVSLKVTGEKNGKSIKVNEGWGMNVYEGEKCLKITSDNSETWKAIEIELKGDEVAGDTSENFVFPEYEYMEFYARAESKLESPYAIKEIGLRNGPGIPQKAGTGMKYKVKRSELYLEIGQMWQKYRVYLKGMELKKGKTQLFLNLFDGTLYLDEIKLVRTDKN